MKIRLTEKKPYAYILFSSEGLAKFNFSLKVFFTGGPESSGECHIELSGDLNPFIRDMAERPLRALIDTMSEKLSRL